MKLLNKTLRSYLIGSFLVLLVTLPLFYFVVKTVLLHAVDRSLRLQLRDIRSNLPSIRSTNELEIWAKLDKDIRLEKVPGFFKDTLYTGYISRKRRDLDPVRQLDACIVVDGRYYKLSILISLVENEDLLTSIVLVQTLLLILLITGILWVNRRSSKKLWTPFYSILSTIRRYDMTKHETIGFEKTDTDEFNDLNKNLEILLNRNYSTYLSQKEFTENAAHEMQTPLAIFQSQLENLLQTTPLSEEQVQLIVQLENNNQRLIKLNRSLLMLAKIENEEFQPTEKIDVAELTGKFTESYQSIIRKKNISFYEIYKDPLAIIANRSLIEVLISNLVSNAVRHNVPAGQIRIESSSGSLIIKNTGLPESLSPDKMYERFSRQKSSQEGVGLGLAMIRRICQIYHLQLNYYFENNFHIFRIDFPKN
jgi:two-component system, OmpR family, sensor histidine kinase ArlS